MIYEKKKIDEYYFNEIWNFISYELYNCLINKNKTKNVNNK